MPETSRVAIRVLVRHQTLDRAASLHHSPAVSQSGLAADWYKISTSRICCHSPHSFSSIVDNLECEIDFNLVLEETSNGELTLDIFI